LDRKLYRGGKYSYKMYRRDDRGTLRGYKRYLPCPVYARSFRWAVSLSSGGENEPYLIAQEKGKLSNLHHRCRPDRILVSKDT
jgi:hypothetical protein